MVDVKLRSDGRVVLGRTAEEQKARLLWRFEPFVKLDVLVRNADLSYHLPMAPVASEKWDAEKGVNYLRTLWFDVTELFYGKKDMSILGILRGARKGMVRNFWEALVEHEIRPAEWVAWRCSWWSTSRKVGDAAPLRLVMCGAQVANKGMRGVFHRTREEFGNEVVYPEKARWVLERHAVFRRLLARAALSGDVTMSTINAALRRAFDLADDEGFERATELVKEAAFCCGEELELLKRRIYDGHFVWNLARYESLKTKRLPLASGER